MNQSDIAHTRLINQQIARSTFRTARELVGWMGAMQAQDSNMVRWAIGSRLPDSTEAQIAAALDTGELVRTHLLRPTWHVVAAEDSYWLLEVTAPQIKTLLKSRHKELEITEEIITKSYGLIEKALLGQQHLTRDELMSELRKAAIPTDNNRSAHLMLRAELDGLVCNGAIRGKKATYALLEERVPKPNPLPREEALAKLARRYFTSHGPATLPDFVWWSGLSVTDAKRALELIKADFISESVDAQTYWFSPSISPSTSDSESVYLLPAFDEFIISYKGRKATLTNENHKQTVSENGIFYPSLVQNGQVIGTWKRTTKKDRTIVEPAFFQSPDTSVMDLLEKACVPYSRFLGQKIEIAH